MPTPDLFITELRLHLIIRLEEVVEEGEKLRQALTALGPPTADELEAAKSRSGATLAP